MQTTRKFVVATIRSSSRSYAQAVLLLLVARAAGLVLPLATRFVVDDILRRHNSAMLPLVVAAVLTGALVQAAASKRLMAITGSIVHETIAGIRDRLNAHILRLPIGWHDSHPSSSVAASVLHDSERLRTLMGPGMVDFAGGIVASGMAGVLLMRLSGRLTVIVAAAAAMAAALLWVSCQRIRPMARARGQLHERIATQLADGFAGVRTIRAYQAEADHEESLRVSLKEWQELNDRGQRVSASLGANMLLVAGALEAVIIWVGCGDVIAGRLTIGALATYVITLGYLLFPMFQIVSLGPQVVDAISASDRICSLLACAEEEFTEHKAPARSDAFEVQFEGVAFGYSDAESAIRDVTFVARSGTTTAIVGCSGAGKSTLIGLIAGFYRPRAGCVRIGGVDAFGMGRALRSVTALASQDAYLFDGTIGDNITCGRVIEPERFECACRITGVDSFVRELPDGYDTQVRERGLRLSGGQKQRVCIARAILGDPAILLLDEATSNIDLAGEGELRRELQRFMLGRTVITVGHRLSTVRHADEIIVLHGGRVAERGTHETLTRAGGAYARMFAAEIAAEATFAAAQ